MDRRRGRGEPQRGRRAALALVDAAADAGADAVKFQTFRTDRLAAATAPKARYQERDGAAGESQADMLRRLELPRAALEAVAERARTRGLTFFSSPFDAESADLLAGLGVPAFKLGSGELTNTPLVRHVARHRRPLILSTGMATLAEVEVAVRAVADVGNEQLVLLQCVSSYPADPAHANLRAMATMAAAFRVPVGFSDHMLENEASLAAVALGASVIEKHLTLDRTDRGPDHAASLDPSGFAALVRGLRIVEAALGDGVKRPTPAEADVARVARRSVVLVRDLPAGAVLEASHLALLRPGTGIEPGALPLVVGRRLARSLPAGTPLEWGMLG